jgi:uncharacterized protein
MRCLFAAAMAAFLLSSGVARAGEYAPLDCGRAKSPAEKTICGSYALGQDEARMATLYATATSLVAMGQRGDMQGAQRDWLQTRENCGDRVGCLNTAYAMRIKDLNATIAAIASRGPF